YSFTVGTWRVIVLNSVCWAVGGCGSQSPQAQWLRAELALAAQSTTCVAAITHHPPFSSGRHGPTFELRALWQILYEAGADLVLAGHDHLYERFAPQDSHGRLDLTRGIRQITVGTGGRSHYAFRGVAQNSEVRSTGTFGVLKLSLTSTAYAWQFVPVRGKTFADSGTTGCH
ncbi:MAG: metallophosphoesterase family protein, partial [Armatimonadota bacterium]